MSKAGAATPEGGSLSAGALLSGLLFGLVVLGIAAVVIGTVGLRLILAEGLREWLVAGAQGAAAFAAGLWAGQRAGSGGLVHGVAAALLLVLALSLLSIGLSPQGLPGWGVLLRWALAAGLLGALGGIVGVGLSPRR